MLWQKLSLRWCSVVYPMLLWKQSSIWRCIKVRYQINTRIVHCVFNYIKHYRDISECNSVCGGNRAQKCGGGFKNNIYKRKEGKGRVWVKHKTCILKLKAKALICGHITSRYLVCLSLISPNIQSPKLSNMHSLYQRQTGIST